MRNMVARHCEEIAMTAIEQRHRDPDCRHAEAADDRAATLAALSGELTERLRKHPLPPRPHPLEGKHPRWPALWRIGLPPTLAVAACIAALTVTPSGTVWKELGRLMTLPADTSPADSSAMTVSAAAATAATTPSPQSTAPPFDPPTIASAPVNEPTTIAPRVDSLQRVEERELTWTEVHELQVRLRALKFDPGPLDGVKGPLTSAAVRRFQESQGDRVTGDIGLRTLIRLRQATAAPE
jgi:hypothetical protein